MFRGSSSVFQAINYGCYPIYLNVNKNFDINPLYNLDEIQYANNIKVLNELFKKDFSRSLASIKTEMPNYFNAPKIDLSDISN